MSLIWYKIRFDFLTADAKELLFFKMLKEKIIGNPTNVELEKIRMIPNLTPGDFKVVRQKNFFGEPLLVSHFIEQLEIEASYKKGKRPVGIAP